MIIKFAAGWATAVPGKGPFAARGTELDEPILFGTALGAWLGTYLGETTDVEGGHVLDGVVCSEDVA